MRKSWTKEFVISEFNNYKENGGCVRSSEIRKNRLDLYKAILRYFKGYKEFLEIMGLDFKEIHGRQFWTEEKIILEFKRYINDGGNIRSNIFQSNRPDLYTQISRKFNGYNKFLEILGYDFKEIHGMQYWTDEDIVHEFKQFEEANEDLSYKNIESKRCDLFSQICRRYGDYRTFIENVLGYNYSQIKRRHEWSRQKVINEIQKRYTTGESIISSFVKEDDSALHNAAFRYFSSYKDAVIESGYDYDKIVENTNFMSYAGILFEDILAEALDALKTGHTRHFRGFDGIIPDFYNGKTKEIIDAKLSTWTVFNSKTIDKYSPHCERLVIVYLRGNDDLRNSDTLNFRHVSSYYDDLSIIGRRDIVEKFNDLLIKIKDHEFIKDAS